MLKLGGLIGKNNNSKMEKLKRFFSSLMFGLMAVCAMTLSACGDDDDDNGGGSSSTSSVDNPLVNDGGLLLTSISYQSGNYNYMETYYIYYDAKLRPYKYTCEDDDYAEDVYIIDYDNGKMDTPDGDSNVSLSFNSKGYITKVKGSWSYSEDGDNYSVSLEWNASYDKDGHLTVMTVNQEAKSDESIDKGTLKTTLSWTGGNLVSFNTDSKWYYEDGQVVDVSESSTGICFTYGTQQNKYKQYPAILAASEDTGLFNMGLFGLGPNNLPTSYSEVHVDEDEGDKYEYKENYTSTFTLNDNGSIDTEIWTSDRDNYSKKYMYSYSDVNSVSRGITRSVAMTSTMSASDKAKRIRDFMHKLPFVPKRRSGK